jgi:hypothetical protein
MGVRIDAYAIDVPPFEDFLAQASGRVLRYVVEHASAPEAAVVWWDTDRGPICAVPREGVFRVLQVRKENLLEASSSRDPFMIRSAEDYLREGHSLRLSSILDALSRCPDAKFVRRITEGYRRWWIGSLLDFAEQSRLLTPEDYARCALVWQKLLRGYGCGKLLPSRKFYLASFQFPILPADDTDMYMGVWTEEEAYFLVGCLRRILEAGPRFKAPPLEVGIGPETDDDWNDWVHEMIGQFLVIEALNDYSRLAVVSFIDS